ncbi:unnamed protein product, partial [Mesorhabditis belari]|uniref:Uncharacterized protein n=1 Tax=Mesorhabditis belari TaxID=2138241 RepID=A0AAF3JAG9_9BILA
MRKTSHVQSRMRRARSDPVLIKPSQKDFMQNWNSVEPEPSCYDRDADPLYGILIRIAELDLSGVPRHSSAEERYKMGQKMERQQKRRHSIMVANMTVAGYSDDGIRQSTSAPDILQLYLSAGFHPKRVSFSIEAILPPTYHSGLRTENPPSPSSKPILLRRSMDQIDTSLPLTHMDYDMFAAWRRGSRLSIDVQLHKYQMESPRKRRGSKGSPFEVVKSALLTCFQRRTYCKTTPQE